MRNKEYFKKKLFEFLIVAGVFILVWFVLDGVEYCKYKVNFNYRINAILKVVEDKYPDVSREELLDILRVKYENGNVLREYGYDLENDSFIYQNDIIYLRFSILKLLCLLGLFLILICVVLRYSKRNDREIDKIIKCIEDINHKNYELNLDDISEDKLSILKQEIYKTTVMLKESAENSWKDKIELKNSLQDISHQLKTPLTSINIMLDNIIDDPDMEVGVREKFVRNIKREVKNISFLVQSILKLSKFESNTISFVRDNIKISSIIDDAIMNVSNLCDLRDISIKVNNKCRGEVFCDLRWQVEAITNILKNALEYSSEGGVVLIECEDNNLYSQIKIIDYGKGMDEDDVENIFKRFYKGKEASVDSIGIGLSLAKVIIEKDNGRIIVESKKDEGTIFTIKYFR